MTQNRLNHPCFNDQVRHLYGRIHLPVAPRCNIQCNFCNRKYDCMNESRPGVTGKVLTPVQAIYYLEKALAKEPNLKVAGIAGPGDPFANPDETMETISRVRQLFPDLLLCVATNGLNIAPYIGQLARAQLSHVTITINAIDPEIGSRIYAWVRDGKVVYRGLEAAQLLLERQLEAVRELKDRGITVKVNSIIVPGINDRHIEAVAKKVGELGTDIMNCVPLYPVKETAFENIEAPSTVMVSLVRNEAGRYLTQMEHCTRCRADAAGLLGAPLHKELAAVMNEAVDQDNLNRPYVAVASLEGLLINQHLGEASQLLIYGRTKTGFELIETRKTPESGGGKERWLELAGILSDCRAVLVSGAGESPKSVLKDSGLKIIEAEGIIDEALMNIYSGREIRNYKASRSCCSGTGVGCG